MAHLDRLHALGHGGDKLVVDPRGDNQAARGRATLAGRVERTLYRQLDSLLEVGIVENDLRVLATHLQLHLGLARYTTDRDLTPNAHRPGETDAIDFRAVDQHVADHTATAHHQVEHTGGETGAGDDFGQGPGAARHQLGRLDHHAVAVGQGRGDFPRGDGDREVPRGDQTHHTEGFAGHFNVDARAHRRHVIARQAQAFTGEEFEDIAGAGHLANGFGQGLALFPGQQGAEFFTTGEDLAADFIQRIVTRLDTGGGPRRERGAGSVDGRVDLGHVGFGVFANGVGHIRRVDVGAVVGAGYPFAIDVVLKTLCLGHESSPDAKGR